jgi:hypothetical protein
MQVVVAKKLFVLFVANAGINQYQAFAILYQQATHGPGAKIVMHRQGLFFAIMALGTTPNMAPPSKFKKAGIYGM